MNLGLTTVMTTVISVSVALFAPPAEAKSRKEIKMTFEVKDGELQLRKGRWYTTPSNCARKDHDGCYEIPIDFYGKFELTLRKGDAECDDPDRWKWHAVTLGGESRVESPGDKPEVWGKISEDAARDFDADPETGVVNIVADGRKRVNFESANDFPHSIWYKVAVENCGTGEILEYDPRVDNRGQPGN